MFNVSTDFLLGEVDVPDRLNYNYFRTWLVGTGGEKSVHAQGESRVVNALLENPEFSNTTNLISGYLDDEFAKKFCGTELAVRNCRWYAENLTGSS